MPVSNLLRALFSLLIAVLLAGCAASVIRTAEQDKAVKSVAVVSLLDEQTRVDRIGLTVFNNKSGLVDQTGTLNNFAIDTVEGLLHTSRPGWVLRDARGDLGTLLAAQRAGGTSWKTQISSFQKELAALASKLDADFIFVVIDTNLENSPGRGVGIRLRTMNPSSVGNALVHSVCTLVLVDRNGNEITNRWGGQEATYSSVPAASLGLDYDLSTIDTRETQDKLKTAMRERLKASLTNSARVMGY